MNRSDSSMTSRRRKPNPRLERVPGGAFEVPEVGLLLKHQLPDLVVTAYLNKLTIRG